MTIIWIAYTILAIFVIGWLILTCWAFFPSDHKTGDWHYGWQISWGKLLFAGILGLFWFPILLIWLFSEKDTK